MRMDNRFNRIVVIEPNLISYGHVVEVPLLIQRFLLKEKINFEIIGNKLMEKQVQKLFSKKHLYISNTCFSNLSDNGNQFYTDLKQLSKKLHLNNGDLVIVSTSYINEALGVQKFVQENSSKCPIFALWFHQLYPPEKNFLLTTKIGYRREVASRFKKLCSINKKVHFFTTPSEKLRQTYQKWTNCKFGKLPIPCDMEDDNNAPPRHQNPTVGFLGDGRYEKGLLFVLGLILHRKDNLHYIIQNLNPRGYPTHDQKKLIKYIQQVSLKRNVEFYNEPLLPRDFSNLLNLVDIVLLPYHPQSYDARVSAILIQGIMKKKIVIATRETWLEKQVAALKIGETFKYSNNFEKNLKNISRELNKALQNTDYETEEASRKYRGYYTSRNFFRELFRQIA